MVVGPTCQPIFFIPLSVLSPSQRRCPHVHLADERREKGGCRRYVAKALLLGSWDPP
jgi:hypothetical protein